jgi:RNA polymerase sigma factor (TIGR02999 family)
VPLASLQLDSAERDITALLAGFRRGDQEAEARLLPLLYQELHRLAEVQMSRERRDHTLEPAALVHELFLRLRREQQPEWKDRGFFFGIAARQMRQILVDSARRRQSDKRGGDWQRVALGDSPFASPRDAAELLALEQCLGHLARQDRRQAQIVELKFFAGLSVAEIAAALQVSPRTVKRDWVMARAWLRREMSR